MFNDQNAALLRCHSTSFASASARHAEGGPLSLRTRGVTMPLATERPLTRRQARFCSRVSGCSAPGVNCMLGFSCLWERK
jgi:hypothetical protein